MKTLLGVVFFVAGTAAGASLALPVPWTPVPLTLQALFVFLAGAVLGPWAGGTALSLYLVLGAWGAPVFSGGNGGFEWLMGPTGGYLIVYPAAAFAVGLLTQSESATLRRDLGALLVGLVVLYAGGASQLWLLTGVAASQLLALGVLPFIASDLLKVLAALAMLRAWRALAHSGQAGDVLSPAALSSFSAVEGETSDLAATAPTSMEQPR